MTRFSVDKNKEFQEYATTHGRSLPGIGLMTDTWLRLPDGLLVLGEYHNNTNAVDIKRATNLRDSMYRKEGTVDNSKERKIIPNTTGVSLVNAKIDPQAAVEDAVPYFGRMFAHMLQIAKLQGDPQTRANVAAGKPWGGPKWNRYDYHNARNGWD